MMNTLALIAIAVAQWGSYQACGNTNCEMCYGATPYYTGGSRTRVVQQVQPGRQQQQAPLPADYAGSPAAVIERGLSYARVGKGDLLVDLGSGDGRVVLAAMKRGALAYGVEHNAGLVQRARAAGASTVQADLFAVNLSRATVLWFYLTPELLEKLAPKLLALEQKVRIISYQHALPGIKQQVILIEDGQTIYYYRSPLEQIEQPIVPAAPDLRSFMIVPTEYYGF